jgi:hypothetical protein
VIEVRVELVGQPGVRVEMEIEEAMEKQNLGQVRIVETDLTKVAGTPWIEPPQPGGRFAGSR